MKPKELVVVSGKGGTGKTSLTASFATLAGRAVLADCDVDAADLHLLLAPRVRIRHIFRSGRRAEIRSEDCLGCGTCSDLCRFGAIEPSESANGSGEVSRVVEELCEGCGVCVRFCPESAIDFPERVCGEWMVSETRCGPMVHARLGVAGENSGKLVSQVRSEARRIAEQERLDLVLVDGPPGIGCPAIASLTGAALALVVIEPSLSGQHDLKRVLELTRHFELPATVCVNKWDLDPEMADRIDADARNAGALPIGRIRYDPTVTSAQMQERTVVEAGGCAGEDMEGIWSNLSSMLRTGDDGFGR